MISTIPVWIIFISSILNIEKTNIFQILGVILSLTGVIFIITKITQKILYQLGAGTLYITCQAGSGR